MSNTTQYNLFSYELQALIDRYKRNQDDWINATKWCEHFGKKFEDFKSEKKTFLRAAAIKINQTTESLKPMHSKGSNSSNVILSVILKAEGKGRYAQSYVHPIVAIKLAEWLSPEFDVFVKETFKRYLDSDITLADDIIQRSKSEQELIWLEKRLKGKLARKAFTESLQKHGVTGMGYATNTNAIYLEILGKTAQQLKEERGIVKNTTRDDMTAIELSAIDLAELLAIQKIEKTNATGNQETTKISRLTASKLRSIIDSN